ncbi:MAG: NAD-dependent epimerase/dehydratase family protein [Planctomycetaceae bacterium]
MNALVTGGGGFLGLALVEQLVHRGDHVRVLCRGDYPRLRELGVEQVSADIRDTARVVAACQNIETVFHVAAVSGIWGDWSHYHSINTKGTLNVLEGCQTHRVQRLVYTSSPSVVYDGRDHLHADESLPYPSRFLCHYPHSKALAEQAVRKAAADGSLLTVSLRPHLIWGPRDNHLIPRLIARARAGRLVRVGPGTNRISISYVDNAACAHLQAADALQPGAPLNGQAYFINDPEPVAMWPWIDELLRRAGLPSVRRSIPAGLAYAAGWSLETLYHLLGRSTEPPMTRFLAQQLAGSHDYSIERARRDFGYAPPVDHATGMDRLTPDLVRLASS